eukprot:jgi/Hompol1/2747/HPOL_000636-RA
MNGVFACEQGHQYTVEEELDDEDNFGRPGLRRIASGSRRNKKRIEIDYDSLKRRRCTESVFIEELQYALSKQTAYLVDHRGCPKELNDVARDLWLLWVAKLDISFTDRITTAKDWISAGQSEGGTSTRLSTISSKAKRNVYDKFINKCIARTRVEFSQSMSLSLCALACRILGLPILIADIRKWACDGSLPYLALLNQMPAEIRSNFKQQEKNERAIPSLSQLRKSYDGLLAFYIRAYKIDFGDPLVPATVVRLLKLLNMPGWSFFAQHTQSDRPPVDHKITDAI